MHPPSRDRTLDAPDHDARIGDGLGPIPADDKPAGALERLLAFLLSHHVIAGRVLQRTIGLADDPHVPPHEISPVGATVITGDDGRTYWADFVWRDMRIIGEADGALKYATRDDVMREKERQEALERAGWLVIRWNWAEAVTDPSIMIRRIERAIARRRMHPPQS